MATEKRLIDANALMERLKFKRKISEVGLYRGLESAMAQCQKAPTVDVVEVVRCKDCRYRIHDDVTNEWFCNSFNSGFVYAKPNDFCSYGERRSGV